jgi:hypothetical protein
VGALGFALAGLRRARLGKISGIWQRQPCWLPSRAREARADSRELRRRPTCSGRSGFWPHDGEVAGGAISLFSGLVFADSGSGRTLELGRSARQTMMMSASPGRGGGDGAARPTGSINQRWQILKH